MRVPAPDTATATACSARQHSPQVPPEQQMAGTTPISTWFASAASALACRWDRVVPASGPDHIQSRQAREQAQPPAVAAPPVPLLCASRREPPRSLRNSLALEATPVPRHRHESQRVVAVAAVADAVHQLQAELQQQEAQAAAVARQRELLHAELARIDDEVARQLERRQECERQLHQLADQQHQLASVQRDTDTRLRLITKASSRLGRYVERVRNAPSSTVSHGSRGSSRRYQSVALPDLPSPTAVLVDSDEDYNDEESAAVAAAAAAADATAQAPGRPVVAKDAAGDSNNVDPVAPGPARHSVLEPSPHRLALRDPSVAAAPVSVLVLLDGTSAGLAGSAHSLQPWTRASPTAPLVPGVRSSVGPWLRSACRLDGCVVVTGTGAGALAAWRVQLDVGTGVSCGRATAVLPIWSAVPRRPTAVTAVYANEDASSLVAGSADGALDLWTGLDAEPVAVPLGSHASRITALAGLRHGVLSCSRDGTVCGWDTREPRCLSTLVAQAVPLVGVALASDRVAAYTLDASGTLSHWDIRYPGQQAVQNLHTEAEGTCLAMHGSSLVTGHRNGTLSIVSATAKCMRRRTSLSPGSRSSAGVSCISLADKHSIAVGLSSGVVAVYDSDL